MSARWKAIRKLFGSARFEKSNRCPTCGEQMKHACGMGACVDWCPDCDRIRQEFVRMSKPTALSAD